MMTGPNQGIGHPLLYFGDTLSADPGIGCGANVHSGAGWAAGTEMEAQRDFLPPAGQAAYRISGAVPGPGDIGSGDGVHRPR